jgi:hypothetical protein
VPDPKPNKNSYQGLILTLGGAPATPHTVAGLRGQYRPDRPTPIGGEGELSIAEAQAAIDAGAHLEIVTISRTDIDDVRDAAAADIADARRGVVEARQDNPVGAETDQINDHLDAVKD